MLKKINLLFILSLTTSLFFSCQSEKKKLPILGETEIFDNDTVYYSIEDFTFYKQDSAQVSLTDFKDKIVIADFFFTSCPTICPVMKKNMLKIQEKFKDDNRVLLISHSIDPKHDSVARLKIYGEKLGVIPEKWFLVTGEKREIYRMAKNYMVAAMEDENAPGGYAHSGALVLLDKKQRIRGYYDGTIESEIDLLIADIPLLFEE